MPVDLNLSESDAHVIYNALFICRNALSELSGSPIADESNAKIVDQAIELMDRRLCQGDHRDLDDFHLVPILGRHVPLWDCRVDDPS